jgi:NAD(P)-dependent dehydrogenase (short-subunit alcohol dehydrogenase family)
MLTQIPRPEVSNGPAEATHVVNFADASRVNQGHVRCNSILPGKINTPMVIKPRVAQGVQREQVVAARDKMIPPGGKMGEAWDVAYAAHFLHSDEAKFISGVALPVDGGEAMMRGAG